MFQAGKPPPLVKAMPAAMRPRRAVVLAAGLGTRMRPLSYDTPKPLMPLWNVPLLDRVTGLLRAWGVRRILINLHYMPNAMIEHVRRRTPDGLSIDFSFEPRLLGTGGALRRAAWFLDDSPFWMVNADIALRLSPRPLLAAMRAPRTLAALWLVAGRGPRTVSMRDNLITDFRGRGTDAANAYTFSGLHLLSPRILDYLPAGGPASIIDAYENAMANGERVAGVCVPGSYWNDLGTPQNYLQAHGDIVAQSGRRRNFVARAVDARIDAGAITGATVAWSGAHIRHGVDARQAIIGRGCAPRHAVASTTVAAACLPADAQLQAALDHLRWPPQRTTVAPLEPRGSARSFTRLSCGRSSVMMITYSLERRENGLYAGHSRLLAEAGVAVPDLLLDRPRLRLLLLEDMGGQALEKPAGRHANQNLRQCYRVILENLVRMHVNGTRLALRRGHRLAPPFTAALYRWERQLCMRRYMQPAIHPSGASSRRMLVELGASARRLQAGRYCLIHRDLQSTNIFMRHGRPCFIDFQGMRMGPPAYDLASLLCDPYMELPAATALALLGEYNHMAPRRLRITEEIFWHAAVERLAQALGAYGRLSAEPATARFAKHIPAALRQMHTALERLGTHPVLTGVVQSILHAQFAVPR